MRSLARLWPAMVHSVWHSPTVLEVLALRSVLDTGKRTIREELAFLHGQRKAPRAHSI